MSTTQQPSLPFGEDDSEGQRANLARVRSRIGAAVLAFVRQRLDSGRAEFVIAELHAFVREQVGVAPASPDRILRDLRQRGACNYEVVSRRASRYRALSVASEASA